VVVPGEVGEIILCNNVKYYFRANYKVCPISDYPSWFPYKYEISLKRHDEVTC
jgi:hypothetical protein